MLNRNLFGILMVGVLSLSVFSVGWAAQGKISIQADELDYDMKTGQATAIGNVIIIQDNGKATAEKANYNTKTKSGSLSGKVVAERSDERISCDEFWIINDEDYSAKGNAVLSKGGKSLMAPQVDYYKSRQMAETFGNWSKLVDNDGSIVTAVKIVYDEKNGLVTASGGVNVNSAVRKLSAYADKAIYDTKKDGYVEMIGNATATQDGNTVKGEKLRLTNSNVAIGDGNVHITYIPKQKTDEQGDKPEIAKKEYAVIYKKQNINSQNEA